MNDKSRRTNCLFGISSTSSLKTAEIGFLISHILLKFSIHLINDDVPLLLPLVDMDRLNIQYDNLTETFIHALSGAYAQVTRHFSHLFK